MAVGHMAPATVSSVLTTSSAGTSLPQTSHWSPTTATRLLYGAATR